MAGLKRLDVTFCDCRLVGLGAGPSPSYVVVQDFGFLIHTVTTLLSIGAKSDIYIYDLIYHISSSKGVLIVEWLPKNSQGQGLQRSTITSDR